MNCKNLTIDNISTAQVAEWIQNVYVNEIPLELSWKNKLSLEKIELTHLFKESKYFIMHRKIKSQKY